MKFRKSKHHVHKYPHFGYDIHAAHVLYESELNSWLIFDKGYPPTYKSVIWFLKHKDLIPYITPGKGYDFFNEYISGPRNLRKTLKGFQKKYINLVILGWQYAKEREELREQIRNMK